MRAHPIQRIGAALGICRRSELESVRKQLHRAKLRTAHLENQFQAAQRRIQTLSLSAERLSVEFARILTASDADLKPEPRFVVQESAGGAGWETVTARCCLGGCDMECFIFPSRRDALLFAALLKAIGFEPPKDIACPSCYQEYLQNQI